MTSPTILNNHAPEKINRHYKGKTSDCKTKMTSALTSFSKEIESENPNFIVIDHYNNTVEQRLEDLEEKIYEAIDDTSEEEQAELIVNAYIQQLLDHQPPIKRQPESYINYTTFVKGIIHSLQH